MKTIKLFTLFLVTIFSIHAQDTGSEFIELKDTGVEEFLNLHPEFDGRGTIIIILDTGVDFGVDGLKQTSTGETKFIDVQDFTHEGDVQLYEADLDKEDGKTIFSYEEEELSVQASSALQYSSTDDEYYIGGFAEEILKNSTSGAGDLNGDGDLEDVFDMVAFETSEGGETFWVVYLDLNGNGDISDDRPIRNYKDKQDAFSFVYPGDLPPLTMGLNVLPDQKIVSFHFDDGSHGTHVAGIAGGYHIGGIDFNGVAPGAKMMSMKLGDNLYSGGCTVTESMKKAYEYADKVSKEVKVPVVINMSFGIGSELEGHADIEQFLESLAEENPYLYICLGSGNEGPGISTIGLPSASYAVFASGAVLTKEIGADNYGATLNKDIILYFSSRGGEVRKPDVCSPGACTSTVPNWTGWDRFWGTSMAAPYSAGVVSLLLSAASQEYPDVKIPSQLLFKAIRESATKMDGYSNLDQGHGYINVMNAYELLKKYIDNGEVKRFETYSISSLAPNAPFERAQNLYLRDGSYIKSEETFSFSIKRNGFQEGEKFYRAFRIESDSDWLIPIQKKTYIRNDQLTFLNVKFDLDKMKEPGLYTGRLTAYRDDKAGFPEFEMQATVVMPYRFSYEDSYSRTWKNEKVEQGLFKRYFIDVPAGQSGMNIKLSAAGNDYARARFYLFDPNGIELDHSSTIHTLDNKKEIESTYFNLEPGVYEVDVDGYFLAKGVSTYDLSIQFYGVNRLDDKVVCINDNQIEVVNLFDTPSAYNLKGQFTGYKNAVDTSISGSIKFNMPFVLRKNEASKEIRLNMSKDDFSKLTDLALLILDKDGYQVESDALSYSEGSISITNTSDNDSTEYIFEIVPGFAFNSSSADIQLTEITTFKNEYNFDVMSERKSSVTLYPSLPKQLQINFDMPNEFFPENSQPTGKILFESTSSKKTEYELPIKFKF